MSTPTNVWKQTLAALELDLDPAVISTWFKNTQLFETSEDKIIVACSDSYSKNVIQGRYGEKIAGIVAQLRQKKTPIEFIVKPARMAQPVTGPLFDEAPSVEGLMQSSTNAINIPAGGLAVNNHLNNAYTLDNFVVGVSNRVVHAAATSVIENPGGIYNPLFIYGPTGVGKTHLLHAIGNSIKNRNPAFRILYVTTEQFVNDLIEHIRMKKDMQQFRKKYRTTDVLLIDDIQFLSGKESSQEEFYHTFNELYQLRKQIVIASDREPALINSLADRLISRFKGGLMTNINPPDYETRLAIVTSKAAENNMLIAGPIADYIAQRSIENIREIQGILLQIKSYAMSKNQPINLALVRTILADEDEPQRRRRITPEVILETVTTYFDTSIKDLCGKRRNKEIVIPRQLTMFLLRNELGLNLEAIGEILGGRDHTTVMHGCDRIKDRIEKDDDLVLRSHLHSLRQELYD